MILWASGCFWKSRCWLFASFVRGTWQLASAGLFIKSLHFVLPFPPQMSATMYIQPFSSHVCVCYVRVLIIAFLFCGICFLPGRDACSLDFIGESVFWLPSRFNVKLSAVFPSVELSQIVYIYWNNTSIRFSHAGLIGFHRMLHLHPSDFRQGQRDQRQRRRCTFRTNRVVLNEYIENLHRHTSTEMQKVRWNNIIVTQGLVAVTSFFFFTKTGTRGPKLKHVSLKNYLLHVYIRTNGANYITRTIRGVVERGRKSLSWLRPCLDSTNRASPGVKMNKTDKSWVNRCATTISSTKNHNNFSLTRTLPSNADNEVVFGILKDFLFRVWAISIDLPANAGVLWPDKTNKRNVLFPREAQPKTKYIIWTTGFRWFDSAAINTPTPSLQTSQQGCL